MRNGFTLIELVVTVSLAALVLTLGVPSFREMVASNRLTTQTNDFVATMVLARSEAVTRGVRVSVCASDPDASGNAAQTNCTGEWNAGWIAFTDSDGDCAIDAGVDVKLGVQSGKGAGATVTAVRQDDSAAVTCIGYSARGFSVTDVDIDFTLCQQGTNKSRVVEFTQVGRLKKLDSTCS